MTQGPNNTPARKSVHIVIFPFQGFPTAELEELALRVIFQKLPRKSGKSDGRIRSYYAGRCAVAFLFESIGAKHYITPNSDYGFLEVYNASARKVDSLFINLSHTEQIAVAVMADSSIGVDIEDSNRDAKKVMRRVATSQEIQWIKERPETFLNGKKISTDIFLWSSKEAFSKAVGLGMKFGLQKFEILKNLDAPFKGKSSVNGPLSVMEPSIIIDFYENFLISICTDRKNFLTGIDRRILTRSRFDSLRAKLNC